MLLKILAVATAGWVIKQVVGSESSDESEEERLKYGGCPWHGTYTFRGSVERAECPCCESERYDRM